MSTVVVVPTLGGRPEYLKQSLESIARAGSADVIVVRPSAAREIDDSIESLVTSIVDDPGKGLASAINLGFSKISSRVDFLTWLGDDDRLTPDSLTVARGVLTDRPESPFVFGQCRYIDHSGQQVWMNRSGRWAAPLMLVGPQLVPQPGSLMRRSAFEEAGGLDESLKWAFDLDLFLRMRKLGRPQFRKEVLAEFRWHQGSLSVGSRIGSVKEASMVRVRNHRGPVRFVSPVWEPFVRRAILEAGNRVTRRIEKKSS